MNWFNGEIVNAIELQRRNKSVFIVAVLGQNELSAKYEEILNRNDVSLKLNSTQFVAIKLIPNSIQHRQFLEIFSFAPSPSIHFIAINGSVIKLFYEHIDDNCFPSILDEILDQHKRILKSEPSKINGNKSNIENINGSHIDGNDTEKCNDNVAHKQKLQAHNKIMNKTQCSEIKEKINEIKKERAEEKFIREQVLRQIADDRNKKAEKDAILKNQMEKSAKKIAPSVSVKNDSSVTRIQFRLPDGTVRHHEFDSLVTLSIVYNYVVENLQMFNGTFKLATTFPKVEFTELDYSKNLIELNLTPSAVLLILLVKKTQSSNMFWGMYSKIRNIITYYLMYLSMFIFGDKRDSITSQNEDKEKDKNIDKRKPIEKQGNMHRFKDNTSDDDDDDNKFWNGNSTQQL